MTQDGIDEFDGHSTIFAAWDGDDPVATLRLTRYPYETLNYVPESYLSQFLGDRWRSEYLEFSRLVVSPNFRSHRVSHALATYAGLKVLTCTGYRKYFGYTTPLVRRLLSMFRFEREVLEFQIPSRGTHSYLLLRGDFGGDFEHSRKKAYQRLDSSLLCEDQVAYA